MGWAPNSSTSDKCPYTPATKRGPLPEQSNIKRLPLSNTGHISHQHPLERQRKHWQWYLNLWKRSYPVPGHLSLCSTHTAHLNRKPEEISRLRTVIGRGICAQMFDLHHEGRTSVWALLEVSKGSALVHQGIIHPNSMIFNKNHRFSSFF